MDGSNYGGLFKDRTAPPGRRARSIRFASLLLMLAIVAITLGALLAAGTAIPAVEGI